MRRKTLRLYSNPMRALVILASGDIRCQLEAGLATLGFQFFLASSRADGLPLTYDLKPHLIFLGVGQDAEDK